MWAFIDETGPDNVLFSGFDQGKTYHKYVSCCTLNTNTKSTKQFAVDKELALLSDSNTVLDYL